MNDKLEFYVKVRGIITYLSEEIEKIPTSKKTKKQVLSICETISSEVLGKIGEVDDEVLMPNLNQQLYRFHLLIKDMENNENERVAFQLLITHVGDILYLMKENQK